MAIIKASASHSNIKNVINYVSKKEKTEYKLLSGYNCSPDTAAVEMQLVKELYSKTSGRSYKHFIQSFVPGEVTPETAHRIANEFAEGCSVFSGYQVLIATHIDKEHIHTHFILNSVSCDSGYKFQMTPKDLQAMKDYSDELCRKYNLSICEKGKSLDGSDRTGPTAYDKEKYQFLLAAEQGKVKSYVRDTAIAVHDSLGESKTRDDFISAMASRGYSTEWKDNHKYITFTDPEGKKVRNSNLQKTYNLPVSKDELEHRFCITPVTKETVHKRKR